MQRSVEDVRKAVSDAVHHAVREATGTDGAGFCLDYAVVGSRLASMAFGRRYIPQAGGMMARSTPGHPEGHEWFAIDGSCDGLSRGEFHCWVVSADGNRDGEFRAPDSAEVVDLSSRHYPALCKNCLVAVKDVEISGALLTLTRPRDGSEAWTAPPPPDFIWVKASELPADVRFHVDGRSTAMLTRVVVEDIDYYRGMVRAAERHYRAAGFQFA